MTLANYKPADAYTFWKQIGLNVSQSRITTVDVDGGTAIAPSDAAPAAVAPVATAPRRVPASSLFRISASRDRQPSPRHCYLTPGGLGEPLTRGAEAEPSKNA